MEYIVIKLYLNGIQGDCHDIHIEDFEESFKKMQDYARSINRKLYFAPLTSDQECGLPVECTPFAEIEYTGVLSEAEKKTLVQYIKGFSIDAEIKMPYLNEFCVLKMVKFKKIDDEIFEIS